MFLGSFLCKTRSASSFDTTPKFVWRIREEEPDSFFIKQSSVTESKTRVGENLEERRN